MTVKHEGIEVTGSSVVTINADLKVGTVQETVTVTGEAPIVDIQSTRRQTSFSTDVLNSLPSAKSYAGVAVLNPSVTTAGMDVQTGPTLFVFGGAGVGPTKGACKWTVASVGAPFNGAGYLAVRRRLAEFYRGRYDDFGWDGEAEVGGPTINVIWKEGGNRFSGTISGAGLNSSMVASNYGHAESGWSLVTRIDRQVVGRQPRHRRTNQEGSRLVLLQLP